LARARLEARAVARASREGVAPLVLAALPHRRCTSRPRRKAAPTLAHQEAGGDARSMEERAVTGSLWP
jgi:hypothetical protein